MSNLHAAGGGEPPLNPPLFASQRDPKVVVLAPVPPGGPHDLHNNRGAGEGNGAREAAPHPPHTPRLRQALRVGLFWAPGATQPGDPSWSPRLLCLQETELPQLPQTRCGRAAWPPTCPALQVRLLCSLRVRVSAEPPDPWPGCSRHSTSLQPNPGPRAPPRQPGPLPHQDCHTCPCRAPAGPLATAALPQGAADGTVRSWRAGSSSGRSRARTEA